MKKNDGLITIYVLGSNLILMSRINCDICSQTILMSMSISASLTTFWIPVY